MRTTRFALSLVAAAALGGCASPPPPGPYQPLVGPNAPGPLVIEPILQPYVDVPGGQQNYSYNAAGFLEYNTVVRNRGSQAITLAVNADMYDDQHRVVESQDPIRIFIDPQAEKPLRVAANNRDAKQMRIQVRAAK